MKLASHVLSFIFFSLLFVVVVLPVGWLVRLTIDPHRLRRRPTDSFFNMVPGGARHAPAPADAPLPAQQYPNTGV